MNNAISEHEIACPGIRLAGQKYKLSRRQAEHHRDKRIGSRSKSKKFVISEKSALSTDFCSLHTGRSNQVI